MADEDRIKTLKAELYDLCVKRGDVQVEIEKKTAILLELEKKDKTK